jgi:hypothetical protein
MDHTPAPLKITTIRLPEGLRAAVMKQAKREGRTTSNMMRFMLREGLARRGVTMGDDDEDPRS